MKQFLCDFVLTETGDIDDVATGALAASIARKERAVRQEDQDTFAVEFASYVLENPGLKSIASPSLARALWTRRAEEGKLKGKSEDERTAAFERLVALIPEYVKANPDQLHMGRKSGISVRFVHGEHAVDAKGEKRIGPDGQPVQAYRISDADWTKLTEKKPGKDDAPESK